MATKKAAAETAATEMKARRAARSRTAKASAAPKAEASKAAVEADEIVEAKAAADAKRAAEPKKTASAKATIEAGKATEPKKTAEPKKAAEPKKTAEPKKAAEPKKTAKAKEAAEPKKTAEPKKAAEPKKTAASAAKTTKAAVAKQVEKDVEPKEAQPAKKEPAKKAPAKKEPVKKAATAKEPAKKAAAAKEPVAKEPAKKDPAKKEPAKKASAKKEPAKKAAAAKEPAKKTPPAKRPEEPAAQTLESAAQDARPTGEAALEEAVAAVAAQFEGVGPVLIAAAECAPLVKVGGLADIVGALPKYLGKLGIDARIIMPMHRSIKERYGMQAAHLADFQARLGWRSQYVGLERLELDGTVYYFIDNEFYFGGPIYCGGEFEGEQYAFFTRAVLDALPLLDFKPRILHANDWHTAMMPLLVKTQYLGGMQQGLRTLLTIHNLHFQGQFSHEFDRDLLGVDDSLATPQFVEHYGCDNMLKAGIVFADKVNTVSPTYAREICEPFLGESLDGVLRSRGGDLWGILNGIDEEVWNPATDAHLPERFEAGDLGGKAADKRALLEELGLEPAGEEVPLIAMVGRLTPQKGIDLVQCVLEEILAQDVRMVVLGSGERDYEDFLRDAEARHRGRLCSYIGYAGDLSHRIYAGSDLFLMPSLFEPCGISQMIAMRYGTLPIVRETGGLRDTVVPYNEYTGEGNGFSFANYNAHEMLGAINYALRVWRNGDARKQLIEQAMACDFSFERCARSYAELYRSL